MMKETYSADLIANAKHVKRKISELHFDPENVRFSHIPSEEKNSKSMQEIIEDDPEILDLYEQILSAKGVLEPLIIDSNNTVIEGNRRLTCLLILDKQAKKGELSDDGIKKTQFEEVECRLLQSLDEETRDIFLATIHVKGKKPWKRFNKAKHIYRMNAGHKMSYDEIARILGMGKATVQRNIVVYKEVWKYHVRFKDDKEWFKKFMIFEQFFMRKDLQEFRSRRNNIDDFDKWVYSSKFNNHKDIRKLHDVLRDRDAKREFEKSNMETAIRVLEGKNPGLVDTDFKKISDTITVLKDISRIKLDDIVLNPEKMKMLNSLEVEVKNLMIDLETKKKHLKKV